MYGFESFKAYAFVEPVPDGFVAWSVFEAQHSEVLLGELFPEFS